MKLRRSLLVLALGATLSVAVVGESGAAPPHLGCTRAADFGAVPNDGLDDRAALQAAIDAAQNGPRCLDLAAGTFHATRKPTPGAASIPSLRVTGTLALRGAGEGPGGTVLAMLGSGTLPGATVPSDWRLLDIAAGASGVLVSGLAFDGSQRVGTGEQTHLVQLTGPTTGVVIEHVRFRLPPLGGNTGGDCVRLLGTPTEWVRDTTIRNAVGEDCDRSFVGVQRGVDGLVVERSESVRVGDQAIDFEPTGGAGFNCQPIVKNVLMRNLVLRRAATQGLTVAIGGDGCAVADTVTLTDSIVEDGPVSILDAVNVTLSRLHLRGLDGSSAPTVLARKRIVNLRVLDCVLERGAGSGPGTAIQISGQSGADPTDALLSGVRINQASAGPLIRAERLARLIVTGSELTYTGAPTTDPAIVVRGFADAPAEAPVVVDTRVVGPLGPVVLMGGVFRGDPVLVRVTRA